MALSFQKLVTISAIYGLLLSLPLGGILLAQDNIHTIKGGETLSSIARKYKTTIQELIKNNPEASKGLKAGGTLVIKSKPELESDGNASTTNEKKHKVVPGESLFGIAKKYKISLKQIEQWNGITNKDLKSGQELWVSAPDKKEEQIVAEKEKPEPKESSDFSKHQVKKGETLSGIARRYNVSVAELRKINSLSGNGLKLDQELNIPTGAQPKNIEKAPENISKTIQKLPESTPNLEPAKQDAPKLTEEKPAIVKPEPVLQERTKEIVTKEEQKQTNGSIREVNNTLGYTRVVETGFAEAIEGDGNSKKHLCLHKNAPVGSILQVKNEVNGQTVFVKVIGKLPETGSNEKLIIRVSKQAYDRLFAAGKRFPVEVSYPESQP